MRGSSGCDRPAGLQLRNFEKARVHLQEKARAGHAGCVAAVNWQKV